MVKYFTLFKILLVWLNYGPVTVNRVHANPVENAKELYLTILQWQRAVYGPCAIIYILSPFNHYFNHNLPITLKLLFWVLLSLYWSITFVRSEISPQLLDRVRSYFLQIPKGWVLLSRVSWPPLLSLATPESWNLQLWLKLLSHWSDYHTICFTQLWL